MDADLTRRQKAVVIAEKFRITPKAGRYMVPSQFGSGNYSVAIAGKSAHRAMLNEALCKILCHNIVVLVHEMYELGIDPALTN